MASIKQHGSGYQVRIRKKGHPPIIKTFTKRKTAQLWADRTEDDIERGVYKSYVKADITTLGEALDYYVIKILPKKKSQATVISQVKILKQALGSYSLSAITSSLLADFRDDREEDVCFETVRKDLLLIQRVLNIASSEWGISLPYGNPVKALKLPKPGKGRDRRLLSGEEEYLRGAALKVGGQIHAIIRIALSTAMRRGEIAVMRWKHADFNRRVLKVPDTKTTEPRDVPLSTVAIDVLQQLPRRIDGEVWGIVPEKITDDFERVLKQARTDYLADCKNKGEEPDPAFLVDLRFHDLRHEAVSRLFELGLNPMQVASISGHKTLQMLKRYTHLRAVDLVAMIG